MTTPDIERIIRRAINDPGQHVKRENNSHESMASWQTREVLAALDEQGHVIVSVEDLKGAVEVLKAVNDPWAFVSEEPELEARLRAALPEETTSDAE